MTKAYIKKQNELSVQGGCVLWGAYVVIPLPVLLKELHLNHPGIARMKGLAKAGRGGLRWMQVWRRW